MVIPVHYLQEQGGILHVPRCLQFHVYPLQGLDIQSETGLFLFCLVLQSPRPGSDTLSHFLLPLFQTAHHLRERPVTVLLCSLR